MKWAWAQLRLDTLFLRLFVLMWVTLVASHVVAYLTVVPNMLGPGAGAGAGAGPERGPGPASGPAGPGPGPRPGFGPRPDDGGPPGPPGQRRPPPREGFSPGLPTLPSLPPGNPFWSGNRPLPDIGGPEMDQADGPGGPGLPRQALWLDYGIRMLLIAFGAAIGARWLSAPMRRLSAAAKTLGDGFAHGTVPPPLDPSRGTVEVRETALVFNQMAKRLQEQFDARGLHMAALSHDLRTPLARLRLRLEQLPGGAADASIRDIQDMDEMIDATLAVLREQRDGAPPPVVDLVALLQAITDDRAEVGQAVALQDSTPTRVRAHPAALKRIVGNLIDNALRHGGGARLAVAAEGESACVTIDDDGPGIAPGDIEQAFKPWVRLASGSPGGHGLGLAIARDLAERDGAALGLANRPEGGLRASLRLPIG